MWKDGKQDGYGHLCYAEGRVKHGWWKEGSFTSEDLSVDDCDFDSDGYSFVGGYKGDKMNGIGIITSKYGDYAAGEIMDSQPHGYVVMHSPLKNADYIGQYYGWTTNNKCAVKSADGRYDGEWKDDLRDGFGISNAKGGCYEGYFEKDMPHGYGVLFYANGDRYAGYWQNGKKSGFGMRIRIKTATATSVIGTMTSRAAWAYVSTTRAKCTRASGTTTSPQAFPN